MVKNRAAAPNAANIVEGLRPLERPLGDAMPDPRNARKHDAANLAAIKNSLVLYGQRRPIVVNEKTSVIEAGNGVWLAAKALGWLTLAMLMVDDAEAQARAFALMENKAGDLSSFDMPILKDILQDLDDGSLDLTAATGFSEKELEDLMTASGPSAEQTAGESCPTCGQRIRQKKGAK